MRREYYKYRGNKNSWKIKEGIATRQDDMLRDVMRRAKQSQSEDARVIDETEEVMNDDEVQGQQDYVDGSAQEPELKEEVNTAEERN